MPLRPRPRRASGQSATHLLVLIVVLASTVAVVIPVLSEDAGRAAARLWCNVPFVDVDSSGCSESEDRADLDESSLPQRNDATQHDSALDLGGLDRPLLGPEKPTRGGKLAQLARDFVPTEGESDTLVNPDVLGPHLAASDSSLFASASEHLVVAQAAEQLTDGQESDAQRRQGRQGRKPDLRVVHDADRVTPPSEPEPDPPKRRKPGVLRRLVGGTLTVGRYLTRAVPVLGTVLFWESDIEPWLVEWIRYLDEISPPLIDIQFDEDNRIEVDWHDGAGSLRVSLRADGVDYDDRIFIVTGFGTDRFVVREGRDGPILGTMDLNENHEDNRWTFLLRNLPPPLKEKLFEEYPTPQDIAEDPGLVWDPDNHPALPPLQVGGQFYVEIDGVIYIIDPTTGFRRPFAFVGSSSTDPNATRMAAENGSTGETPASGDNGDNGQSDDDENDLDRSLGWRQGYYTQRIDGVQADPYSNAERVANNAARIRVRTNGTLRQLWPNPDDDSLLLDLRESDTPGYVFTPTPLDQQPLLITDLPTSQQDHAHRARQRRQAQYRSVSGSPIPDGFGLSRGGVTPFGSLRQDRFFHGPDGEIIASDPVDVVAPTGSPVEIVPEPIRAEHDDPPGFVRGGPDGELIYQMLGVDEGGRETALWLYALTDGIQSVPELAPLVAPAEIVRFNHYGQAVLARPHPGDEEVFLPEDIEDPDARAIAFANRDRARALAAQFAGANADGQVDLGNGVTATLDTSSLMVDSNGEIAPGWWRPFTVDLGRPAARTGLHEFPPNREEPEYLAFESSPQRDWVVAKTTLLGEGLRAWLPENGIEFEELETEGLQQNVLRVMPLKTRGLLSLGDVPDPGGIDSPRSRALKQQDALLKIMALLVGARFDEVDDEYVLNRPIARVVGVALESEENLNVYIVPSTGNYFVNVSSYFDASGNLRAIGPIQLELREASVVDEELKRFDEGGLPYRPMQEFRIFDSPNLVDLAVEWTDRLIEAENKMGHLEIPSATHGEGMAPTTVSEPPRAGRSLWPSYAFVGSNTATEELVVAEEARNRGYVYSVVGADPDGVVTLEDGSQVLVIAEFLYDARGVAGAMQPLRIVRLPEE